MEPAQARTPRTLSRRTVAAGLAWSTPAVAIATAAPALAVSPPSEPTSPNNYQFRGSAYSELSYSSDVPGDCQVAGSQTPGVQVTDIYFTNQVPMTETLVQPNGEEAEVDLPLGFAVTELPQTGSGAKSETTQATVGAPLQLVVAYPHGLVDTKVGTNGYTFFGGTEGNWSGPTLREDVPMTNPYGQESRYDVFVFEWRHSGRSQETVIDGSLTGANPQSWLGTPLDGIFATQSTYCSTALTGNGNTDYYYAGYYMNGTAASLLNEAGKMGGFTVANGGTAAPVGPIDGDSWFMHNKS